MTDEIEQGTAEWHARRCGRVTASRVCHIVARTKSGYSATRKNYLSELLTERMTGVQEPGFTSKEMQWGKDCEAAAVAAYEFYRNVDCTKVGFIDHPTIAMAGASPDRLVGADGMIEIKCPNTATHIETLISKRIDPDYVTQMMWQMACTGRKWCDFVSFDPRMPMHRRLFVKRVHRDPMAVVKAESEVKTFIEELEARIIAVDRACDEDHLEAAE